MLLPHLALRAGRPALARRAVLASACLALVVVPAAASSAMTATPGRSAHPAAQVARPDTARRTTNPTNPLAGRYWGVYKGNADHAWTAYAKSKGHHRALLAKIALRPKAGWFGAWTSNAVVAKRVHSYIASATAGHRGALVQMTDFRSVPWEGKACKRLPTAAEQASYKQWTDRFAAAIGSTHVALILQPDGPFALCAPHGSRLPSRLIEYAARKFSALPHTSVYIEIGAADWLRSNPAKALQILTPAGIGLSRVRGFALNSDHYDSTAKEVEFGTTVVDTLAAHGITGKHFVVNTAENGRPFDGYTYKGSNFDNATVCKTRTQRRCVTLGIPPTTDVANPKWHLSAHDNARAAKWVDGYLWFGRPWLYKQADPFVLSRALHLAATTPY